MSVTLQGLVGEPGDESIDMFFEGGEEVQVSLMIDFEAAMDVVDIRLHPEQLHGFVFLSAHQGGADNIDDAGFGDEAIAGVEAPRVAVPAQQGIVGEMIGFEGELSVGGSFHGGVDEMRLPETKTFSHGNR